MPRGASASVFDHLGALGRIIVVAALVGISSGCVARPVGDFGRAQPGVLHDTIMPLAGDGLAMARKEPVSNLNQTDQEVQMHDRTWRFLIAAHGRDWMFDSSVELQRTRIGRARDYQFSVDRYYTWLRTTDYRSSPTRYATVGRHVLADLDTLPTTFLSICAVLEVDRQRRVALAELSGIEQSVADNVAARRAENTWHVDWFVRALNYRYDSYAYALDHLLVETPHEQSMSVDETLRRMKPWVDRANRGDFCTGASGVGSGAGFTIPSRYQTMAIDNEVILQK